MATAIAYQPRLQRKFTNFAAVEANMCWTCRSCEAECPVNIYTGALHPQKIIRLATLGLWEELLALPVI
jgi:heterodisulfide reductase subunit C